jgi:hypothetical protein
MLNGVDRVITRSKLCSSLCLCYLIDRRPYRLGTFDVDSLENDSISSRRRLECQTTLLAEMETDTLECR